ncbi:MAG: type I-E CRISPR-associated protein Cse1/CasA [Gracilibacteraceae bacterium]|nr:type I-E CRISPR-associated protein Cse1/CasA [Gracilibacteraceae bacterium]
MGKDPSPAPAVTPPWKKQTNTDMQTDTPQKPKWATNTSYPLITYSDGDEIKQISTSLPERSTAVTFEYLPDELLLEKLSELLSDGGCAGVICNTVDRAQQTALLLKERMGMTTDIEIIHARFMGFDRMRKEKALRDKLGPRSNTEDGSRPGRLIVVGTQVLEQSLDIDFDLLFSDIAPMDLMLQRVGRLHRHDRKRPAKLAAAKCFVTGVEDTDTWEFAGVIEKIYSRYALLNTLLLLPVAPNRVTLPDDISLLVQSAYTVPEGSGASPAESLIDRESDIVYAQTKHKIYKKAKEDYNKAIEHKEKKAEAFRLRRPSDNAKDSLVDLLDIMKNNKDELKAEASVRDIAESLEVIVVQKKSNGRLYLLPWVDDESKGVRPGAEISTEYTPESDIARLAATCTVSLPLRLCNPGIIDKVIGTLERKAIDSGVGSWQESPLLRGFLPLILNENLKAEICGHAVEYSEEIGLSMFPSIRVKRYMKMNKNKLNNFVVGDTLTDTIAKLTGDSSGKYKQRDFVAPLINYCTDGNYNGKIGIVYGLRSTGKTVGMLQAAEALTEHGCRVAYARFNYEGSGMRDANAEIISLAEKGYTHFFVDEATYLGGFMNLSAEWPDKFVPMYGIKIIVSGTDSFLLWLSRGTSLFHRYEQFSTNWNSFPEYKRVLGKTFEDYKTHGGIFTSDTMPEFIRYAVVDNLIHSIDHCLEDADRTNEYTGRLYGIDAAIIYKAIISILKCAVEPDLKNHFIKNAGIKNIMGLGSAISGWAAPDKRDIKERIAESLDIYSEFKGVDRPELVIEALVSFLVKVDCLMEAFSATSDFGGSKRELLYYFSHNSLMYYAVRETINGALSLDGINRTGFERGIRQAAEGYLNESIVFAHILHASDSDEKVFKYRDLANREIDAVVINRKAEAIHLIEVKSKGKIDERNVFANEAQHLYDDGILRNIGVDNSFTITRVLVYSGESREIPHAKGNLKLANIEEFLCRQGDLSGYLDSFAIYDISQMLIIRDTKGVNEPEYNLLDEKWIRVLGKDGTLTDVSLLEVFERAHLYRRLANETETVDIVILRLLLAILYAVFSSVDADGNSDPLTDDNALSRWQTLWERKAIPYAQIEEYLQSFRERFYLFHPDKPFYQAADLDARKCTEYRTPKLIGDISQSGNKVRLFFSRTDSDYIDYPEAARWLLHLNAFDDSAVKPSERGVGMESSGVGWLGKLGLLFSAGRNLFETLLLNFVLLNSDKEVFKEGRPVWEKAICAKERVRIVQPSNLAELYTLQSRRILLTRKDNAVVGYKLIGGDFFGEENAFIEQMTLWWQNPKTENFTPMKHRPSRQLWRDFSALVASRDGDKPPGVVHWHEVLINKKIIDDVQVKFSAPSIEYKLGSKVIDMFSDSVSINSYILSDLGAEWRRLIAENLEFTDKAVQSFGRFASDLALAEGADNEKGNIARIRGAAREDAYGELDIPFRNWLAGLTGGKDMEAALSLWQQTVKSLLTQLANAKLNDASDAAFIGRYVNKGGGKKNLSTASKAEIYFRAALI